MRATQKKRSRSSGSNPRKKQNTSDKTPVLVAPRNPAVVKAIGATVTTTTDDTGGPAGPATHAKPANPWKNRTKKVPDWWGTTYHDMSHFSPMMDKPYHGVWGTRKLATVEAWVVKARASVNSDDDRVVASKPGTDGRYDFLVDMGERVGYLSGALVPLGTQPQANHVAVYLDAKGNVSTMFPCTPDAF
jgi:hypothetical protein